MARHELPELLPTIEIIKAFRDLAPYPTEVWEEDIGDDASVRIGLRWLSLGGARGNDERDEWLRANVDVWHDTHGLNVGDVFTREFTGEYESIVYLRREPPNVSTGVD